MEIFLDIQRGKNKMLEASRKEQYNNSPRHRKDVHVYHKLYNEKEASTPQTILNKFLQRNKILIKNVSNIWNYNI